jgi:RNA polymerase sigma-70 factor (ECF subfamily)
VAPSPTTTVAEVGAGLQAVDRGDREQPQGQPLEGRSATPRRRPNRACAGVVSSAVMTLVAAVPVPPPDPPDGFETLFRDHYGRLVRTLTLAAGDREVAADAVQEAFVRAHVRWARIEGYEDPIGWVRRVAVNLLHDDRRRKDRTRRAVERLAAEPSAVPAPREPDELDRLLDALPPQQRTAVALHYVEELSIAEVAAAMGLAPGSVKSHLHDARRRLRTRLERGA